MTSPVEPAKFTTVADVTSRYVEGDFPAGKAEWVQERIVDVESMLIGLVPSLGAPVGEIEDARRRRVVALVADKVLELYRNPRGAGARNKTSTMDGFSVSDNETFRDKTTSQAIWFSEQELNSVRKRKRRSDLRSIPVAPWNVPC